MEYNQLFNEHSIDISTLPKIKSFSSKNSVKPLNYTYIKQQKKDSQYCSNNNNTIKPTLKRKFDMI